MGTGDGMFQANEKRNSGLRSSADLAVRDERRVLFRVERGILVLGIGLAASVSVERDSGDNNNKASNAAYNDAGDGGRALGRNVIGTEL